MSGKERVLELRRAANATFTAGDYSTAITLYTNAIRQCETHRFSEDLHLLYSNRSAAQLKSLRFQEALADAQQALAICPRHVKSLYRSAVACNALGQHAMALEHLHQAASLDTSNSEVESLIKQISSTLKSPPSSSSSSEKHTSSHQTSPSQAQLPTPGTNLTAKMVSDAALTAFSLPSSVIPSTLRQGHVFAPSPDGHNENLLILLHGLGDRSAPYAGFAKKVSLPKTATLAIGGPIVIPETDGGRAWFSAFDDDWELIKPRRDDTRRTTSLASSLDMLQKLVVEMVKFGWPHSRIHLFGFSQGGSTAVHLMRRFTHQEQLGGCISISGGMLEEELWKLEGGCPPIPENQLNQMGPILITHGDRDDVVPRLVMEQTVQQLTIEGAKKVVLHTIPGKKHGMVGSRDETRHLMAFWASTLTTSTPKGFVEVSSGV